MININKFLKENADVKYADFNRKFITSSHQILGVRLPKLQKFAKEIEPEYIELNPSSAHEEILLYAYAAAQINDESEQLEYLQNLLPYIDNWATCDCSVSALKMLCGEKSYELFMNLLQDARAYYVRVGVVGLMHNFLKTDKLEEILSSLKKVENQEHTVKMAIAWLYCELAAFDFPLAKKAIFENPDKKIQRYAVQKIKASRRIDKNLKSQI